ncbi:hypothetical protein TNCV_2858141 [Trichonephila clavipes]|nr:hypothetical protein TNCV_2858141 [Trichonephila clavipes]
MNKIRKHQPFDEICERGSILLDCPTASSEEFASLYYDDNVCPALIMEDILEFVQRSKYIIDADSADENIVVMQLLFTRHAK